MIRLVRSFLLLVSFSLSFFFATRLDLEFCFSRSSQRRATRDQERSW